MKLYVEGVTPTGWKVIGWLEIINGQAFVCQKDDATLGVKKYAIKEITKFLGVREAESVFFGEKLG